MKYKIEIEYDGSKYKGWQRLKNTDKTIQAKIEILLSKLLDKNIEIQGSGRTDAGVHAYGQVAHFETEEEINVENFLNACNKMLPNDIVIKNIEEVPLDFHARFSVKSKIYKYRIWNNKIPSALNRKYVYHVPDKLDVNAMKKAANYLIGEHDFKNFTATKTNKSTIRNVFSIDIKVEDDEVNITFYGEGFLYKMVRLLTGTLINVGLGQINVEDVIKLLDSKEKTITYAAPAQGLYLFEVRY